jgi:hypothetical protein
MTAMRQRPSTLLARSLVCAVLLAACGPQAGGTTVTPGGTGTGGTDPAPQGTTEGQGMAELEKRLGDLVDRKHGLSPQAAGDAGKCEQLCDLATSICSVQEKLCELADDHPDDDAYQALCREARAECREAQESCVGCVETNQSRTPPNQTVPPAAE